MVECQHIASGAEAIIEKKWQIRERGGKKNGCTGGMK